MRSLWGSSAADVLLASVREAVRSHHPNPPRIPQPPFLRSAAKVPRFPFISLASFGFNPTTFKTPVRTSVATEFNSGEHAYNTIKPRSPSIGNMMPMVPWGFILTQRRVTAPCGWPQPVGTRPRLRGGYALCGCDRRKRIKTFSTLHTLDSGDEASLGKGNLPVCRQVVSPTC